MTESLDAIINQTMDRDELMSADAKLIVKAVNDLIRRLYAKDLHMTSWYGDLPANTPGQPLSFRLKSAAKKILGRAGDSTCVGRENRGADYQPLPDSADDGRFPWFLFWEIVSVMRYGPQLTAQMRVLDAGGTSSLFSSYLGSLGCEVHSIDLNPLLVANGNRVAQAMGWKMKSYAMNMKKLEFPDAFFDHAYSICVFEHLDFDIKQAALHEIARCLMPGGILSITFDYRNPAPFVVGVGADTRERNQIKLPQDVTRNFLATSRFQLVGDRDFFE